MSKIICDRYRIEGYEASEIFAACNYETNPACALAIDVCQERTRLYCIPARWEADRHPDGSFTVKRYRHQVTHA